MKKNSNKKILGAQQLKQYDFSEQSKRKEEESPLINPEDFGTNLQSEGNDMDHETLQRKFMVNKKTNHPDIVNADPTEKKGKAGVNKPDQSKIKKGFNPNGNILDQYVWDNQLEFDSKMPDAEVEIKLMTQNGKKFDIPKSLRIDKYGYEIKKSKYFKLKKCIIINDSFVSSAKHARIAYADQMFLLQDIGSFYGTYFYMQPGKRILLKPKMIFSMGGVLFETLIINHNYISFKILLPLKVVEEEKEEEKKGSKVNEVDDINPFKQKKDEKKKKREVIKDQLDFEKNGSVIEIGNEESKKNKSNYYPIENETLEDDTYAKMIYDGKNFFMEAVKKNKG